MNDNHFHFTGGELHQGIGKRLDRAIHISLDNNRKIFDLTLFDLFGEIIERYESALAEILFAFQLLPLQAYFPRFTLIGEDDKFIPRLRDAVESEKLDRL